MRLEARAMVSVLSGEGRSAISIVRVWGPDAIMIADRAFRIRNPPGLAMTPTGRPRLGRIGAGLGDEAVAIVLDGPPTQVEFQVHGGRAAKQLVLDALIEAGASRRSPGDWLDESGDRISAEAHADLSVAATLRAAEVLFDQAEGSLSRELEEILREIKRSPPHAIERMSRLLDVSPFGLRIRDGWSIVLAGRPNVGKSRLLNALAGFDRAIVDLAPGTTRDLVTLRSAIAGWPVEITDTAGIRGSSDPIESDGIGRAIEARKKADLVLLILDQSQPLEPTDIELLAGNPTAIRVANKSDLAGCWRPIDHAAISISAQLGSGIASLLDVIAARLVPEPPPAEAPIPFRLRHVRALLAARRRLESADMNRAIRLIRLLIG